jgi:hypothetical protein
MDQYKTLIILYILQQHQQQSFNEYHLSVRQVLGHPSSTLSHLYCSITLLSKHDFCDDMEQALSGCLSKDKFQKYFVIPQVFFQLNFDFINQLQFKLVFYQLIQKLDSYFVVVLGR